MKKIELTEEKETLLVPLLGKAMENNKSNPIIVDPKAAEIIGKIDYDFISLKVPEKTNILMCIRAKMIDDFTKDFLLNNSNCRVLHLGCGLDSRYHRIANEDVDWYDLDFEEVIAIRQNFFKNTSRYQMIGSSVTDYDWIDKISKMSKHNLIIAEGLFMYLKEDEIKELINRLNNRLGNYTLIFDAYSVLTAKNANNHPSIKKTGAKINWGIDQPVALEDWSPRIKLTDQQYFTEYEGINALNTGSRLMFKFANLFSMAKNAHRLLVYRFSSQ